MADGDTLLDPDGRRLLRSDGKKSLDTGADNTCCCGSGSSAVCDCGTCTSSTTPRGIHLLGFDGPGVCALLGSGTNYYKVLGTIDLSLSLPQASIQTTPWCNVFWSDSTHRNSGLTVYYFRDAACTIPQSVAGGVTSSPFIITNVNFTYSCRILDTTTGLFGAGWVVNIWMTDNHFFSLQLQFTLAPSPVACEGSATVNFTPTSAQANVVGSGSAIIAAA